GDEREGPVGGQGLHGLARGVGRGGPAGQLRLVTADGGTPAPHPDVVQRAVAGDPGRPAAEPVRVAAEPLQVAGDLQPCLGRHVLGVGVPDECPYVAQQARVHGSVHSPERGLVPVLCRTHRGRQLRVVPQHRARPSAPEPAPPARTGLLAVVVCPIALRSPAVARSWSCDRSWPGANGTLRPETTRRPCSYRMQLTRDTAGVTQNARRAL